jgi:hypothetical protein
VQNCYFTKLNIYIFTITFTCSSCFHILFRNLMARQDMSELGFGKELETDSINIDDQKDIVALFLLAMSNLARAPFLYFIFFILSFG